MYVRLCLTSMIDVWLGMIDVMLIVRYMLVCVRERERERELDNNIEHSFNRVKT